MTAPIERLRAVLAAAPSLPQTVEEVDPRGLLPRCDSRALAVLGTLHPALLAVVEATRARRAAYDRVSCPNDGQLYLDALTAEEAALDALDVAIAAALPESP